MTTWFRKFIFLMGRPGISTSIATSIGFALLYAAEHPFGHQSWQQLVVTILVIYALDNILSQLIALWRGPLDVVGSGEQRNSEPT